MTLRLALLVVLGWTALLAAGEGLSEGFEDRVAGSLPRGWGGIWGTQGDDLLIVSNLRAATGRQALLIDRTGDNTAMWGVTHSLPDATEGWLHLSFAFLVQGAGHDARFGFEIRERAPAQRRVAGLRFGASRVEAVPMSESGGYLDAERIRLGGFAKDVWHRIDLWLPASGSASRKGLARIWQYRGDGRWAPVGPAQALAVVPPPRERGYGQLMFVASPGARGYRLFLDDVLAEEVPALAEGE